MARFCLAYRVSRSDYLAMTRTERQAFEDEADRMTRT